KGTIQYNLHDGKNITGDIKAKVGDSVLLTLPKAEVKEVFSREKGAAVFLVGGKGKGNKGTLQSVEGDDAVYDKDGATIETATEHLFVIGKGKPALTFN
ncbi:TPA: hypothetical protein HA278_02925, partial [Candidatus Woesearchaeota archaeon]|nr:hypothetical protein [Candidatus Woesearchaeota archaeon]